VRHSHKNIFDAGLGTINGEITTSRGLSTGMSRTNPPLSLQGEILAPNPAEEKKRKKEKLKKRRREIKKTLKERGLENTNRVTVKQTEV
jgi:hypothetical protein